MQLHKRQKRKRARYLLSSISSSSSVASAIVAKKGSCLPERSLLTFLASLKPASSKSSTMLAETCAWIIRTSTQLAAHSHCRAESWPESWSTFASTHTQRDRERIYIFNLLGALPRIYQQMKAIVTRRDELA